MATTTKRLTAAPQSRTKHVVRKNGKTVRVYYTDKTKGSSSDKTMKASAKGAKVAIGKNWIQEARNYGIQYVKNKYGSKITADVEKVLRYHKGQRADGQSKLNAPPEARDGYQAQSSRFADGGPAQALAANPNLAKRKYGLNLENDEELAQGSQHPWAQATSISSLITGQLRQAANAPIDAWESWAQGNGGTTEILKRGSSDMGVDVGYTPAGPVSTQANSSPLGAFGTSMVMDQQQEEDDGEHGTDLAPGQGEDGLKNPWAEGYGGATNAYGVAQETITSSTMQAMALANAYFAPQRMELAYELGDMETDMRRLSVNLGRQVDDPVLQAKLYKEGMRAVRTMDTQQNTFAFQMAEQRRKEEVQNYQFYDQMAQQEYNLRIANQQFNDRLELDGLYYGLKKDELDSMRPQTGPANTAPVEGTENSPVGAPPGGAPVPAGTPPKTTTPTTPTNTGTGGGNVTGGKFDWNSIPY